MDIFCDIFNQRFVWNSRNAAECALILTQNNDQPLRLYLLQPSSYPASAYPYTYDISSGDSQSIALVSLRDVSSVPATLASTLPLDHIRNGFSGILHTNTQQIADFLAGRAERDVAFCVDLVDGGGHKISPFRRSLKLRAIDSGTTVPTVAGEIYIPAITGFIGGGAANLDGVTTAGLPLGTLIRVIVNIAATPVLSEWRIQAGNDVTNLAGGIVQPLDHDPVTNPVELVLVSGTAV